MNAPRPTVEDLITLYGLEPMPLEGGLFRRTWAGPPRPDGRPTGSAITVLLSPADDQFSAMHRLPADEVWHFYLGDPVELVLLEPDGGSRVVVLGQDVLGGQHVQFTVTAGTWMGGRVVAGGQWALFGCTMAPGFSSEDYEGGDARALSAQYPEAAGLIEALCRPGVPLRHQSGSEGTIGRPAAMSVSSPRAETHRSGFPDLTGQTVLVTGASGGIGSAIAQRFAQAGAAVVVHGHSGKGRAEQLVAELTAQGHRALALSADLTDEAACRRLVADSAAWSGRLTGLVNCAGIQPVRQLAEMTTAEWRQVLDTNLVGAFACTQAAAPVLADCGGGSITHIASIEGRHPARNHAHYCSSKAALIMHARTAALEYGRRGIRVNTVSPGLIDRQGLQEEWPAGFHRWQKAAPLGRLGRAQDVADACVFLASPLASWISGHDLVVDGGVSSVPTW